MESPLRMAPSRNPRSLAEPAQDVPFLEWPAMFAKLRHGFKQGDHVAIIGPTGTGKTHMALEIAELRSYVLVVACKPKDPLVEDTAKRGYWRVPGNKLEIPYADGKPLHKKVVYWPKLEEQTARRLQTHERLRAERSLQKPLVGGAIGYVRANGHWCLVIDEGTWVCRDLNLQRDVDSALFQFRTLNASVVILGQRPAWMGKYVLSQPNHIFLFQTAQHDDLKALGEISGVNNKLVREVVMNLDTDRHECLYVGTRTRELYRTVAPPR